ncbi:MAG TPA: autotransporter domain-containing protein [Steroidobacteraceae bacterium]|nr:autotransporter domain-containing protein [Steroidobacteraceae bacterium]
MSMLMWRPRRAGGDGFYPRVRRALVPFALLALAAGLLPVSALAQAPAIKIAFAPASIQSGATSQLTITFSNPNEGAAFLTATLTDTLPAGLTLVNGNVTGSCPAGAVHAGGGTITYGVESAIPAGGCAFSVAVKGTSASGSTYYTDSIPAGALQTSLGNNAATASGTLTVHAIATVPKLTGLSQNGAATALQAAGLVLGAVQYGAGPAGSVFDTIYAQTPAAGTAVATGSAVTVHVATGKATNVNAPLTSTPGFVQPAQQSVAGALERLCAELQAPGLALSAVQQNLLANCRAILTTYGGGNDPGGLVNALNAISGRQATAIQQTGLLFAGAQFTSIGARLAQLRQGVSGVSFAGLDTGVPMQGSLAQLIQALGGTLRGGSASGASASGAGGGEGGSGAGGSGGGGSGDAGGAHDDQQSRWGFFINGNLRRGTQDTTADEQGFGFQSNGVTAGVDYRLTDHLVFGVAGAHANGITSFTDDSGRLDSRSNSATLYGTYYSDAWYIDVIGSYSLLTYDASRTTTYSIDPSVSPLPTNCAGATCTIDTSGATDARQLAFGTSAGYSFHFGRFELGPDAALDYVHLAVNGFTESDPEDSGMGLAFGDQLGESLTLKAGGHASWAISTPIAVILPQLSGRYVHEFKDDQRALQVHFEDDPSAHALSGPVSNFSVYTDEPDRGYFDWSAGITAQFPYGIAAFASYNAIAGYSSVQLREYAFGIRFQHLVN